MARCHVLVSKRVALLPGMPPGGSTIAAASAGCARRCSKTTRTFDDLILDVGDHQLQVEIVDVGAAKVLNAIVVMPQIFERSRLAHFILDLSQLIERGNCVLRPIHRTTMLSSGIIAYTILITRRDSRNSIRRTGGIRRFLRAGPSSRFARYQSTVALKPRRNPCAVPNRFRGSTFRWSKHIGDRGPDGPRRA